MFRHRAFALYWFSRIASILSFHMLMVAIGWQLYSLTGSAFDLGLIGLAQFVPMLVLTLFVGHVADRYDHRLILIVCQITRGARRRDPGRGTASGRLGPPRIYVVIALVGAARAFEIPTMVAIIPALVPRAWCRGDRLVCLRQPDRPDRRPGARRRALRLGPTRSTASPSCCGASAASFRHDAALSRCRAPPSRSVWRRCWAASASCGSDRVILGTMSLDMCAVFLGGATALLPIFARDILLTGPWGLGLLRAAPAIGALIMSVMLARRPLTLPVGRAVLGDHDLRPR